MTPEERDLITTLLSRLKSAGAAGQQKDAEADALIRQAVREQPDMPYYLVQTVLIQDLTLNQAQGRIAELEQQLADTQAQKSSGTSFLGGLFGRTEPQREEPRSGPWSRGPNVAPPQYGGGSGPGYPQAGYAPPQSYPAQGGYAQPQPQAGGMLGGGGGGFLRSAAATAAGVAGGALLFQGISSMFGHGYANSLSSGGATPGLGETVINNYYGDNAAGGDYGGGGDYGADPGYTGGGPDDGGDYGGGGDDYGDGDYGGGGDLGDNI
jgi:uncharacterized protein